MQFDNARNSLSPSGPVRAGRCVSLIALLLFVSCESLQDAVADGETRTISMHHLHTNEDITITYKRNGRYDEAALKKLNWFLRDWRKQQETNMDPHLIDLVWEVWHEFDTKNPIDIVCGYRSPQTNAMLRRRSGGVARFSQHMLGKAMDFYIPGVPLEQIRIAGLRLQRGGVGYYPTSGSPFVHLDTGSVRYWPRMTREQLVRVFPDGRTAYLPADGRPLSGYSLALADIRKRGSSSESSSAGDTGSHKPSLLAALFSFGKDADEEGDAEESSTSAPKANAARATETKRAAKSPTPVPTARPATYEVASVGPSRPVSLSHSEEKPGQRAAAPSSNDVIAARGFWRGVPALPDRALSPQERVKAASAMTAVGRPDEPEATGSIGSLAEGTLALAYANPSETAVASHPARPMGMTLPAAATSTVIKRMPGDPSPQSASIEPVRAGQHYDDPWLRAVLTTPGVQSFLTTTLWGSPNYRSLEPLMAKPTMSVRMTFSLDPSLGMTTDRFSGEAVVFLSTVSFSNRTASLQ